MRHSFFVLPALTLGLACAHAQPMSTSSEQYKQVSALALTELKCNDTKSVDVRSVGESRVVVTACKRSTSYVYACRQPGPKELEFVTSTPAPPSEESIEEAAEGETGGEGSTRVVELRQQQIKYKEDLVASRLADVQAGTASGYAPRHKMPKMPKAWFESECQYMHESEQ
jgi:hypothetical protein